MEDEGGWREHLASGGEDVQHDVWQDEAQGQDILNLWIIEQQKLSQENFFPSDP